MDLLPFELTIRCEGDTTIVAARSPAGEASAPTTLNEEVFRLSRQQASEPEVATRQIGSQLFEALFPTAVRERYRESLGMARERGARLAITLHCDDPVLLGMPWELAYDPTEGRPLATSRRTPFSRTLSLARPSALLEVEPPLRLLVATASPRGYPPLDISGELQRLEQELQPLLEKELLQMHLLGHATPEALRAALWDSPHLLHLISHGQLDPSGGVEFVLEDKYGDALTLPADELAAALSGIQLRLVLLMACHSSEANLTGRSLGAIGPLLLQAGVGGVVVLSAEFSDHVAIAFSGAFYRALAAGEALSPAINIARHEVWAARRTGTSDWAIPVLFTRDHAGYILATVEEKLDESKAQHNLPAPPTPLIGRERELAEIIERMRQDEVRLVTLTGPGGIGKTRLALEVAHQCLTRYHDGVFFISLASLLDPALAPATIAQRLDVHESGGQHILETLKSALAEREMLLVLDNFEHLMAAAPVVSELLAAAPQLNVLATSREQLHLRGEQQYPISPLETPNAKELDDGLTLAEATSFPAVELFRQRAREAVPSFEWTEANVRTVAEICTRLDGLPLAIELAAARVKLFGTAEALLRRLGSGLKLTGGARDLHPHQQTLHATIEWSYQLLGPEEQTLFRRLGVFVGGLTLEAAEAVCNRDEDLDIDVLDGIQALLDKNLLRRQRQAEAEPRFVILQTICDFALEQLEASGELETLRRAHVNYFLALAEEAEPQVRGEKQAQWLERLEREHDNLRAALRWSRQAAHAETTMRLAAGLSGFWLVRGHLTEGRSWLESVLAGVQRDVHPLLRGRVLRGAGSLSWGQGDYAAARSYHKQSLAIAKELGHKSAIADSLRSLGVVADEQGDYVAAQSYLERGLAIAEELGDQTQTAYALGSLGSVARNQGDYATARSYFERSLTIAEELGDRRQIAGTLGNLGIVAMDQGDYEAARSYQEQCLTTAEEIGDKMKIAIALGNLGLVARNQGDYAAARSYQKQCLTTAEEIGDKMQIAVTLINLAMLETDDDNGGRAARLWAAGERLCEVIGVAIPPNVRETCERSLMAAREQLGKEAFAAAIADGRAMGLDDAIAYALSGPEDEPSERI